MSDDGTSFTIDLPVTGAAKIDAAAASVDVLAARLDGATQAVQASEASYSKAEASADRAAKALERVGLAADVQRSKLRAASEVGDASAVESLTAKLRDLTAEQSVLAERAAKAKVALEAEAAALDKAPKAAAKPAAGEEGEGINFEGVSRGLGKLGGPLASVGRQVADVGAGFGKLSKALGDGGPYVAAAVLVVALAAALVAAAAAAVMATAKILEWGVGLANVNRSAELLAQGIARSVKGGQELTDKIDYLNKRLPLTREELSSTAQRLAEAGLRGANLTNALQTAAIAAAKLKFGPNFQDEMLSLDEQSKVFHANLASIFGGLKIDGLLGALQKLLGLFDEESASGKAMQVVFESVFQPLVDWLTKSEPQIEAFFLQLEIWALKALIAFKPHASILLKVGEACAIVAAIIGGVLVAAVAILAAGLAIPIALFTALVFGVIEFKDKVVEAFSAMKTWLSNLSLADIGKAMIDGLVAGITNGGAAILSAMKGAVGGAVDGAKKLLGIASPSKVFAEIGMQTGAGMAIGVDRSTDAVQGSLESMVSPPPVSKGAAPGASSSGSGSASSGGTSFAGATFVLNGVEGAEDAETRIGALLTRLIEGDATQLGVAVPG